MFAELDSPVPREEFVSRTMKRRSANINVQKSINLLEEAVGSPGSVLRSNKRTPHKSIFSQKGQHDTTQLFGNMSRMGHSTAMATQGSFMLDSFLGESMLDPNASSMIQETEFDATANVTMLLEERPEIVNCTGVHTDFMNKLKANAQSHQVFDLVNEYEAVCQENERLLHSFIKKVAPGQQKTAKLIDMKDILYHEKNTWRLLGSLYKDRLETEAKLHEIGAEDEFVGKYQSEREIVHQLFKNDASIRQTQLVIDWLEKSMEEVLEDYPDPVEFFTSESSGWENTLDMLNQKASHPSSVVSDRPMVTEMDPDAPIRQGKPLADLDIEDENRFLRYMFGLLRAGQLDRAQKLCMKVGQGWRAATLEGWRLYHDRNHSNTIHELLEPVEGNMYRDVWKASCWRMLQEDRIDIFEKAIYAATCGNLKHLLGACETWQDFLWAYLKVMVDVKVEQEIRMNFSIERPWEDLPQEYTEKNLSLETIFQEIQACQSDTVRIQSKERYHVIQKYLILEDVDSLIEEMYEWSKEESRSPEHLQRFMAHLVLFFRAIGVNTKEELCVYIIQAYVKLLIDNRQKQLVATYVSALPPELQIEMYAKFCEDIKESDERREVLSLAEQAGLDIPSITKLVVHNIQMKDKTMFNTEGNLPLQVPTTEIDEDKISAIDWLVFDPTQRAECMKQACSIMRTFLATRKFDACREAFEKIPKDSVDTIISDWQKQTGESTLCGEYDNTIREYMCVKAYLDGYDEFNDWFQHYHHTKPTPPSVPQNANFSEKVAFDHRHKKYQSDLERWHHTLELRTKSAVDKMYNILQFIDGGWMVDQRSDGPKDTSRRHQMMLLRQLCLPNVCFLLLTVLQTTQKYKECLKLADVIASETHCLYKVFRKDELQKLMHKLREASIALLDDNKDPLGYNLS